MEGYFSVTQIADSVKRSKQAIYKLIDNNSELKKILPENTKTVGRGKQYSEVVLTWIKDYYSQIAETEENSQKEKESSLTAEQLEIAMLRQEVEHLKEKLSITEKLLIQAQEEKKELTNQNGGLLLLLSQEKQEKQLLLEAPKKKTIPGILANLFGRSKDNGKNE